MRQTKLVVCAALLQGLALTQANAAVAVINDFENGGNPANFNGGTVSMSSTVLGTNVLRHTGNSPQNLKADFNSAVTDNTQAFGIEFDLAFDVDDSQSGNYGFRTYMEDQNNGVFSLVWKNDINDGNLGLLVGSNTIIDLGLDATWNINTNLADVESFSYHFAFEIFPEPAGNPGESTGSYSLTVERSDGEVASSGQLDWLSNNNLNSSSFDEIVFFNSSSRTTVEIDNFAAGAVPEPSTLFFSLFGTLPFLLRRRRA